MLFLVKKKTQNKKKEEKKAEIFICFLRIMCVECEVYSARIFFNYIAPSGCLFIFECPSAGQQCCAGTMEVFFSLMKAQLLSVDGSFIPLIRCHTYKLKDSVDVYVCVCALLLYTSFVKGYIIGCVNLTIKKMSLLMKENSVFFSKEAINFVLQTHKMSSPHAL